MCGIVGAATQRPITNLLIEGLKRLEYRGYDSAGITLIDPNNQTLITHRVKGKVNTLKLRVEALNCPSTIGIGHTRWATHGAPAEHNAHPHTSNDSISIVHNGIIENHTELRHKLSELGYSFSSETDSEVIAHLLDHTLKTVSDLGQALRQVTQQLKGAYAIGCVSKQHPNSIYAARQGSPLVIGVGFEENFIASDTLALLPVTQRFIFLEEGDMAHIESHQISIYDLESNLVDRPIKTTSMTATMVDKGNHRHFMIKEIFEQPQVAANTLQHATLSGNISLDTFGEQAAHILTSIKRIHIIACGTSLNAGSVAKHWFERHAKLPCHVEIASEHRYRHHAIEPDTLLLALSQSGETADTLAALNQAKKNGYAATLAICNVPESSIVREADMHFITQAGTEIGVAATKTFTAQLVALACLSIALTEAKQNPVANIQTALLKSLPQQINDIFKMEPLIETLATDFIEKQHCLFLGRGKQYAIATEAALKLKEISYIHAESYASGELKHGPIALIDEHMPVIILAPRNELIDKVLSNTQEVQARGGVLYVFSDYPVTNEKTQQGQLTHVKMPPCDDFISPILYNIPMQLLAYHVAIQKGTDVDQPRNLAKSVTVE